jgi:hypothetical protein
MFYYIKILKLLIIDNMDSIYIIMSEPSNELDLLRSKLDNSLKETINIQLKINQIEEKKKFEDLAVKQSSILSRTIYLKHFINELIPSLGTKFLGTYTVKNIKKIRWSESREITCMLVELEESVDIGVLYKLCQTVLPVATNEDDKERYSLFGTILPATKTIEQYEDIYSDPYSASVYVHGKQRVDDTIKRVATHYSLSTKKTFCVICENNRGKYVNNCLGFNTCCPNENAGCIKVLKSYFKAQGMGIPSDGHSESCDKKW